MAPPAAIPIRPRQPAYRRDLATPPVEPAAVSLAPCACQDGGAQARRHGATKPAEAAEPKPVDAMLLEPITNEVRVVRLDCPLGKWVSRLAGPTGTEQPARRDRRGLRPTPPPKKPGPGQRRTVFSSRPSRGRPGPIYQFLVRLNRAPGLRPRGRNCLCEFNCELRDEFPSGSKGTRSDPKVRSRGAPRNC